MSGKVGRRPDGTPADPAVRSCLLHLAQRQSHLVAAAGGALIERVHHGAGVTVGLIDADRLAAITAAGWIDGARLSASGRAVVRLMKAAPAPADARGAEGPRARGDAVASPAIDTTADSPLAWLRARRNRDGSPVLSDAAFAAGEQLRADFNRGHMSPRITANWEAIERTKDEARGAGARARSTGASTSDAAERVRRALATVPPELARLLVDVCCFEHRLPTVERAHGLPQRSAHFLLIVGLHALARHYGLMPPADNAWRPPGGIRHWATEGYRPTIDG